MLCNQSERFSLHSELARPPLCPCGSLICPQRALVASECILHNQATRHRSLHLAEIKLCPGRWLPEERTVAHSRFQPKNSGRCLVEPTEIGHIDKSHLSCNPSCIGFMEI